MDLKKTVLAILETINLKDNVDFKFIYNKQRLYIINVYDLKNTKKISEILDFNSFNIRTGKHRITFSKLVDYNSYLPTKFWSRIITEEDKINQIKKKLFKLFPYSMSDIDLVFDQCKKLNEKKEKKVEYTYQLFDKIFDNALVYNETLKESVEQYFK